MSCSSVFRTLAPGDQVHISIDGRAVEVPAGASVAAALLAAGVTRTRSTPVSGAPRAPYCMMGVCFECLVQIDDQPNRQACLVTVREGMQVRTQEGARALRTEGGAHVR